ncbi:hypothetical protein DPMN_003671 [Dreissena polymorpha]|uniref:B box-type domain-containing protein n=1 Tax=Dreissena polymorpha TaxID=45954 RepID=A0A9D4RUY5_DREPO|nr:hypothetical protein DPMN_003671 [Dreissena polymorpha]
MATGSLSSVPKRLRMVEDFSCTRCLEQNLTESADIYCEKCLRFYCNKCVILHSQFFTKHMTCGREDIKKWPVSKAVEDFLRKCEVHEDETLTQFCHDHSQLCCSACVGIIHRRAPALISSWPSNSTSLACRSPIQNHPFPPLIPSSSHWTSGLKQSASLHKSVQ